MRQCLAKESCTSAAAAFARSCQLRSQLAVARRSFLTGVALSVVCRRLSQRPVVAQCPATQPTGRTAATSRDLAECARTRVQVTSSTRSARQTQLNGRRSTGRAWAQPVNIQRRLLPSLASPLRTRDIDPGLLCPSLEELVSPFVSILVRLPSHRIPQLPCGRVELTLVRSLRLLAAWLVAFFSLTLRQVQNTASILSSSARLASTRLV